MTPKKPLVTVHIENRHLFFMGLLLVVVGVCLPGVFTVDNFGVVKNQLFALRHQDSSYLMIAALELAMLNAVRCYPHYIGSFLAGESIGVSCRGRRRRWPSAVLVAGLIVAVYFCIEAVHRIHYDFGAPALILVTLQVVLWSVNYAYVSPGKKIMLQISFITAFQFLDVMPALNGLPFGRGESSQDIKLAANVLGAEDLLNGMCFLFFGLFLCMGVIILMLLREENHLRQISDLKAQGERIKTEALIQEQENRTYQEMQHLVHDLKSPLTSIQNLVGVMQFTSTGEKEQQYLASIDHSIDNMSQMISEILYQNSMALVTTEALLAVVKPQVSIAPYAKLLRTDNEAPDALVEINRIRMARAVVNLLNNAYAALPSGQGQLVLRVRRMELQKVPVVALSVTDTGRGILPDRLNRVWERGYSSHGSHGLGLVYVKNVVESSGGQVNITSSENKGTTVTIYLPEGGNDDGKV